MKDILPLPDIEKTIHVDELSARDTRALLFQLLYTTDSFDNAVSLESIVDNYNRGFSVEIPFDSRVVQAVQDIMLHRDELDDYYKPLLSNWRIDRIGYCTRLILRFAIWELLYTDCNASIVINEAVELAKCFAEKDAYKFVNGILDEVAKSLGKKDVPMPDEDQPSAEEE